MILLKHLIFTFLIFILISCKGINYSQDNNSKWTGVNDEFISTKILDIGSNRFVYLTVDGLICRRVDSQGYRDVIFFKIQDLDQKKLIKVQDFLVKNNMLIDLKGEINTVPYNRNNCAQFVLYKGFLQEIVQIKDFSLCVKKLEKLVKLINNLIPIEYVSRYKLISYDFELIKGCNFEKPTAASKEK